MSTTSPVPENGAPDPSKAVITTVSPPARLKPDHEATKRTGTAKMARLNFMDLSVDIKTLIVQHVSMASSGRGASLEAVQVVEGRGLTKASKHTRAGSGTQGTHGYLSSRSSDGAEEATHRMRPLRHARSLRNRSPRLCNNGAPVGAWHNGARGNDRAEED